MPAATDGPAVALSFANNFWGKDDAGVGPLLERMHAAKQTCDELRAFYSARASIEDEYARKLASLSRKSLGSQEMGTLKNSLDTVRGEVESMAKQHQNIAAQMKSELEEPLAAFAGGMKERRKIVQNTVEKLLKTKVQQTQLVNKTRDRYEQECLKIKGYLAQGHMVMGQEERKNKAKLEKTQISLATSNTEYEAAVKALEETTARWNREWKAAADKFQDLEEERLDFTKSSLWTFANIASTVCVSDDSSCEKIRLSLENMEVEKDIITFINERGTGQEIPDPPKYINFCRGDVDSQSEASEDESYSVAQFPRSINPAFRSSSPQPSTYESHHDPSSALARDLGHQEPGTPRSRETTVTPQKMAVIPPQQESQSQRSRQQAPRGYQAPRPNLDYNPEEFAPVPHDPYPMDGMTMLCRPTASDLSTAPSATSARPSSRDSHSETSFSSQEPPLSPAKQEPPQQAAVAQDRKVLKKKSGFFQNHSPFRRKSQKEVAPNNRNTWHPANNQSRPALGPGPSRDQQMTLPDRTASPDPIAANASLALNVGNNVFPVDTPGRRNQQAPPPAQEDDPIALALAELKGVTAGAKQATSRMSADHYHGIATPAPGTARGGAAPAGNSAVAAAMRGTPPPSYDQQVQVQRLGVPPPAVTSRAMKEASSKFQAQTRSMFTEQRPGSGGGYGPPAGSMSRPGTRGNDMPRAASPAPPRSTSPRPGSRADPQYASSHRSVSPNPYGGSMRGSVSSHHMAVGPKRGSDQGYAQSSYRGNSPGDIARSASPSPYNGRGGDYGRPSSSMDMAVQLADDGSNYGGSQRGRSNRGGGSHSRAMSFYEGGGAVQPASRTRSKSVADPGRGFTRDGRPIMHFARALYMYQAAIPEELGFAKGDVLAVLRHQDDGWWEATVQGGNGQVGLVPSNYLQTC
ncbi:hypothetical protein QBC34DRAFT_394365 [Podospora aff. communis PSN243]|uniref:Septation protein n=1 Tax=Podospora aff. communis PSN243 TaxID=3040156 RepID=A0AAV9H1T5_9PEZI|nr:hypothetical protein QBC34DRAFT_394365 [Podospora aff. communis PSN243]